MLARIATCVFTAVTLLACSDDHDHDEGNPALSDVIYEGGTSDEALEVMLDLAPQDLASEHVSFVSPAAAAMLSKATPVAIEFVGPTAQINRTPRIRAYDAGAFPSRQSLLADLKALFTPIGTAHAHGAPFNGRGYFLVFADAAKTNRLRVFTNATSFTPTAAQWTGLAAGTQPITLSVTSATFEENAVLTDGGPFVGGSLEFSVR